MSLKALARKVIERENGVGNILILEPKKEESEIPPKPDLRKRIERMLAYGPRPYQEILEAVGADEDALREVREALPQEEGIFSRYSATFQEGSHSPGKNDPLQKNSVADESSTQTPKRSDTFLDPGTCLNLPENKAQKLIDLGLAMAVDTPPKCPAPSPVPPASTKMTMSRYSRGERVKFFGRHSRDILEGEIIAILRPAPDGTPWYQVRGRDQVTYISENHIIR